MSHYFQNDEALEHEDISVRFTLFGESFLFQSDRGVFSKDGLDDGTRLLLETIAKTDLGTEILDLGTGIGPIGVLLAYYGKGRHLTMVDVNERALACAKKNAERYGVLSRTEILPSDVYQSLEGRTYDAIVTNPPIRAGKKVTYAMYAGASDHLNQGGRLILVIRKQQGAESCEAYLKTLYSDVQVAASHKGYRVLIATKQGAI